MKAFSLIPLRIVAVLTHVLKCICKLQNFKCVCADSCACVCLCSPVEMSAHDMVCFDKTFEAAEALLHMESPGGLHNERSTGKHCQCNAGHGVGGLIAAVSLCSRIRYLGRKTEGKCFFLMSDDLLRTSRNLSWSQAVTIIND